MSRFTKCDTLFRKVVLLDRPNSCERCYKSPAQISHILPKGSHPRVRYYKMNVLLLCYHCHFFFWHKSPLEAREWLVKYKGDTHLDEIRALERVVPKVDLKLLEIAFKEILKDA